MPNIEDSNKPIQPKNLIGKSQQKPQETAGIPTPPNDEDVTPIVETDLRKDPKAAIGRSTVGFQYMPDPTTKAGIQKDIALLNDFFAQNREFADFLIDLRDIIQAKHPDWTQEQVVDLTIQIAQELEKQLKEKSA